MQCSKTWLENKGISAVIFDFDGTLYDNSKVAKYLIKAKPLYMFRMLADRKARKTLKGAYYETEEAFLREYSKTASKKCLFHCSAKSFLDWYQNTYMPLMTKVLHDNCRTGTGSDGNGAFEVNKVFAELQALNIKTAILSDYPFVKERMAALGISEENLDLIKASQELGGLKPAAALFEKVAGQLGVEAGRVLVVGDRDDTDGQGARNAGMQYHIINREFPATCFAQYLPFSASDGEPS